MPSLIVIHAPGPDRDALASFLSRGGATVAVHATLDEFRHGQPDGGRGDDRGEGAPAADVVLIAHEQFLSSPAGSQVLDGYRTVIVGSRKSAPSHPWTARVSEPYFLSQIRAEIDRVAGWKPPSAAAPDSVAAGARTDAAASRSFDPGGVFRGLAHAFANPLTAAQGWLQLLSVDLGEGDQRQRAVRQVRAELFRIERYIQALAMIGRRPGGLRAAVDIAAVVRDRVRDLHREGIAVELQDAPDSLPRVHADPASIDVMVDLLLRPFVEERSRVKEAVIAVGRQGAAVEIRITENCEERPAELDAGDLGLLLRHFRASRALGIAMARVLVEGRAGGDVRIEPEDGAGRATLVIRIPAVESEAGAEAHG